MTNGSENVQISLGERARVGKKGEHHGRAAIATKEDNGDQTATVFGKSGSYHRNRRHLTEEDRLLSFRRQKLRGEP